MDSKAVAVRRLKKFKEELLVPWKMMSSLCNGRG
jgi:hypothetical protein